LSADGAGAAIAPPLLCCGGIFIVPLLTGLFGFVPQHAVGTSLMTIIFTALLSVAIWSEQMGNPVFAAMGIARDDKAMRQDWVMRGFRQFDAPVCVIVTYDRVLDGSDDTPFDCGAVATALVNAAWSRGLGAVINSQGIMQSPVVREHAGIADDQVIMKSIALGWPDESFPANAVVSERRSVEEATVFVGFGN